MRRRNVAAGLWRVAPVLLLAGLASVVLAGDWVSYKAPAYGFSMLIPAGTHPKESEYGDGWGGLQAHHEGAELYGLAKLGTQATPEEIERFAVKMLGIPSSEWETVDQGKVSNGWKWYRTVKASHGDVVLYGGYGTGAKGSYLLVLKTSEEDFGEHESDYQKWYRSIQLQ